MNHPFLIAMITFSLLSCSKEPSPSYIKSNGIILSDSDEQGSKTTGLALEKKMYVNSLEGLNVRSDPNISSSIVTTLMHKQEVAVIDSTKNTIHIDGIPGEWTLVAVNQIRGWVFGGFLEEDIKTIENAHKYEGKYTYSSHVITKAVNVETDDISKNSDKIFVNLSHIKGNTFQIAYDFIVTGGPHELENNKVILPPNKDDGQFYDFMGEKGGGGRYGYLYLKDDYILLEYNYHQLYFDEEKDDWSDDGEELYFEMILKK